MKKNSFMMLITEKGANQDQRNQLKRTAGFKPIKLFFIVTDKQLFFTPSAW